MNQTKGYVSFVLHAHLPFIHHPESENYLEEQWLFEAISETYIPLLINFKKLEEEKVDFRITMSMTPPLLSMLDNKLLQKRYIKYLKTHIELCKKELVRTAYDERLNKLSQYYLDRFTEDLRIFKDVYNCNLIKDRLLLHLWLQSHPQQLIHSFPCLNHDQQYMVQIQFPLSRI